MKYRHFGRKERATLVGGFCNKNSCETCPASRLCTVNPYAISDYEFLQLVLAIDFYGETPKSIKRNEVGLVAMGKIIPKPKVW